MRQKRWFGVGAAAILAGSGFLGMSAFGKTGSTTRPARLTKPWSELKDLTEEQEAKIRSIHEKALAEEKAIKAKETSDCMEILSDTQKKELAEAEIDVKKAAAERKLAGKEESGAPATKPSAAAK